MGNERYESIVVNIVDGELTWRYKLEEATRSGSMVHEEDVSGWSDKEIIDLTRSMLDVDDDQRSIIEVVWL